MPPKQHEVHLAIASRRRAEHHDAARLPDRALAVADALACALTLAARRPRRRPQARRPRRRRALGRALAAADALCPDAPLPAPTPPAVLVADALCPVAAQPAPTHPCPPPTPSAPPCAPCPDASLCEHRTPAPAAAALRIFLKTNARRSKQPRPAPSTGQGPILQGEASRPGPQQAPVGAPWQIGEAQVAGPGSPPSPWTAAPSLSRRAAADPSELRRIASAKRGGDNAPVSQRRLERSMTGAARALRGLQFLDQSVVTQGSWPEVEKRFDRLAVDGLLLRSRFSKCIGMVGSEEFAAQMVDALTQRRGIVAQVLTKDELREFWEQLSDSGSWLSQFVSTRSGSGSISQITLSSVCFNAFRFREYITDNIRFSLFQHKSSCLCQVLICQVVVLSRSNFCGQMFRDQMILDLLLIIGS
ncbi:uncharacterized protein [Aegilops tauschii subsp. strangulata]|uniref:uncharacterized protein n=1 Tax=Aegilops tauschii subsp. strangulata TaxID=200361 RepID=UPI000989B326